MFRTYPSNVSLSTSHNHVIESTPARRFTARAYLRCVSSDVEKWRFWFSNAVDSTFADGEIAWPNRLGGAWKIHSARIGDGGKAFYGERGVAPEVTGWTEVRFDGQAGREIAPGETFWSDEATFSLPEGHFLVWEWEIEGCEIPCTMDSQALCYTGPDAEHLSCDTFCPMPDLFGAQREVKNRIVFWGDSITQGCGTNTNQYGSWVPKIADGLGKDFSVWNIGLGYARGSDAATCGVWMDKALTADTVCMAFGTNDLGSGSYRRGRGDTAEEILATMETLIVKLKENGVRVILFTPPPFCFTQQTYENWKKLQEAYPDFAREHGVELFDFEASLDAEPPYGNICQYGAHPDCRGGTAAANAFLACRFFGE